MFTAKIQTTQQNRKYCKLLLLSSKFSCYCSFIRASATELQRYSEEKYLEEDGSDGYRL